MDTRCLKPHLEKVKAAVGELPGTIIADAGYGGAGIPTVPVSWLAKGKLRA
jgi:hypothetical protein